jgi:hypothetical protein
MHSEYGVCHIVGNTHQQRLLSLDLQAWQPWWLHLASQSSICHLWSLLRKRMCWMTLLLLLMLLMLRWLCNYITSGQQRQGIIVNLK